MFEIIIQPRDNVSLMSTEDGTMPELIRLTILANWLININGNNNNYKFICKT